MAGAVTPDGLAARVTGENVMKRLSVFSDIARGHNGNRASGTAGFQASADYVAGTLRSAGFLVSTPTFDFPRFSSGPVTLSADGENVSASVVQYSGGTGDQTLSGRPMTVAGLGCAATDYPPTVGGSIAVINRGSCTFTRKVAAAGKAGARAVIIVDTEPGPAQGMTIDPGDATLPTIAVGRDLGDRIRSAASVSLSVPATTTTVSSRNVIAQTTAGAADDVVIAGAHLDSVPEGPGINDNGSGAAALLETAVQFGSRPDVRRAVRFAFWGAEEDGLIGSTRYVASLDDDARRAAALYLNFDMIGSPNAGYFVYDGDNSDGVGVGPGPKGSAGIERVFTRYFESRRIPVQGSDFDGRSDYGPFIEAGIAAGGIDTGAEQKKTPEQAARWGGTAGQAFDPNYHQRGDDVGNINTAALAITAPAVAYGVATYAIGTAVE